MQVNQRFLSTPSRHRHHGIKLNEPVKPPECPLKYPRRSTSMLLCAATLLLLSTSSTVFADDLNVYATTDKEGGGTLTYSQDIVDASLYGSEWILTDPITNIISAGNTITFSDKSITRPSNLAGCGCIYGNYNEITAGTELGTNVRFGSITVGNATDGGNNITITGTAEIEDTVYGGYNKLKTWYDDDSEVMNDLTSGSVITGTLTSGDITSYGNTITLNDTVNIKYNLEGTSNDLEATAYINIDGPVKSQSPN